MLSIFMGFVFAGLLQLLGATGPIETPQKRAIVALVIANLALLSSLIFLHYTANQVIRFWHIFFPDSRVRRMGSVLFGVGVTAMQASVVVLLLGKDLDALALVVAVGTLLITIVNAAFRGIHKNAEYVRNVD